MLVLYLVHAIFAIFQIYTLKRRILHQIIFTHKVIQGQLLVIYKMGIFKIVIKNINLINKLFLLFIHIIKIYFNKN